MPSRLRVIERREAVEIDGKLYPINNTHKVYIIALKIIRSDRIFEEDKIEALLPLLFSEEIPKEKGADAVLSFFNAFSDSGKRSVQHSFDVVADLEYIYAGFLQTYGIDLDGDDMSIEKFIALLKGLPSDTRLADIIKIRTMEVPKPTKYNAKQIADIIRMKHEFALDKGDTAKSMKALGNTIKEWAEHGR